MVQVKHFELFLTNGCRIADFWRGDVAYSVVHSQIEVDGALLETIRTFGAKMQKENGENGVTAGSQHREICRMLPVKKRVLVVSSVTDFFA